MSSYGDRAFTCRNWKLNPSGCPDSSNNCRYSHRDTGTMSPAMNTVCQSWKDGCCYENQDECLYSHVDQSASPDQQSVIRFPEHVRSSRNIATATAAGPVGFGRLNRETSFDLTNAIRATNRMIFSDYVLQSNFDDDDDDESDQSRNPSSIICVESLPPYGQVQRNRGAGRTESFPGGFAATRGVNRAILPRENTSSPWLTGSNLEPLPSRPIRRRELYEDVLYSSPKPKRPKSEAGLLVDLIKNETTQPIIDLTSDDDDSPIDLTRDDSISAKSPSRPQVPSIPQPRQRRELSSTPYRPQVSSINQPGRQKEHPIPPYHPQVLDITQPGRQKENPIISYRPQIPSITQPGRQREYPIPPYRPQVLDLTQPGRQRETPIVSYRSQVPSITQPGRQREYPIISHRPQPPAKPALPPNQQTLIRSETKAKMKQVLLRLQQNQFNMRKNRNVLQARWEADTSLQRMSVTTNLTHLSECMELAEDATTEAVELLKKQFGV